MIDQLEESKKKLDKYRFQNDRKENCQEIDPFIYSDIINNLYQQNMLITDQLTPNLSKSIQNVCNRLDTPMKCIKAFVDSSDVLNASCLVTGTDETILRFSSRLINLLDEEEMEFIIGHELGHFLLNHGYVEHHEPDREITIQDQMNSRYKEISSDRIGLIAAPSTKKAISAMFKLITGLDNKHLRFDISAFISQFEESENIYSNQTMFSSHPSSLVRCRALLWFSMTDSSRNKLDHFNKEEMDKLDKRISDDFKKYIDGPILKRLDNILLEFKLWAAVKTIISDGIFDKEEQGIFKEMFGDEKMVKMINFFKAYKHSEIKDIIDNNYEMAQKELIYNYPDSYEQEINQILETINEKYDN